MPKLRLMRDAVTAFALLFFLWLIAMKLQQTGGEVMNGPFRAVDGDTLSLEIGAGRFRLTGLDAPELAQTCGKEPQQWACGEAARSRLAELIAVDTQCQGQRHDKYGRLLVSCLAAGRDPAARLVREGLALADGAYSIEEAMAREEKRGIWAGDFERPADWRRRHAAMGDGEEMRDGFDWLWRILE